MPTISGVVRDQSNNLASGFPVFLLRADTGELLDRTVTGNGSARVYDDPHYADAVLILRCNGSNGSTTFTDESSSPRTVTATGGAQVSTGTKKYGSGSLATTGTGQYLTVQSNAVMALGTGDFTVHWWQYLTALTAYTPIDFRAGTASSPRLMVYNTDPGSSPKTDIKLYVNGSDRISSGNGVIATASWQHIALVRSQGVTRMYVNGVQVGAPWLDTTNYTASDWAIARNASTSVRYINGFMDDVCVFKVAKWLKDFTPPTREVGTAASPSGGPLGEYSIDTTYTGEVIRLIRNPSTSPIYNDKYDRVVLS